jgi:AraC family transcriptional regulator
LSPQAFPVRHDATTASAVGDGATTYATVLRSAGGEQLRAMLRQGDPQAVCAALYASPPYAIRVPAMPVSRLSLNLTAARVTGGSRDERPRSHDAARHSLFLAPAGAEMAWRKDAPSRHLTLYYGAGLFGDGEMPFAPLAQRDVLHNLKVPGLRALVDPLVEELCQGGPGSADAANCLARLVLIQAFRHLSKARDEPTSLGPRSIERLTDYVMANLGERILVGDMARQLGLSTDRFAWDFKARTGQSPHQFVLALRLRQAQQLLRATPMPIAEVSLACGFASQQHMTNAMRRHLGITPARYRVQMRDAG